MFVEQPLASPGSAKYNLYKVLNCDLLLREFLLWESNWFGFQCSWRNQEPDTWSLEGYWPKGIAAVSINGDYLVYPWNTPLGPSCLQGFSPNDMMRDPSIYTITLPTPNILSLPHPLTWILPSLNMWLTKHSHPSFLFPLRDGSCW